MKFEFNNIPDLKFALVGIITGVISAASFIMSNGLGVRYVDALGGAVIPWHQNITTSSDVAWLPFVDVVNEKTPSLNIFSHFIPGLLFGLGLLLLMRQHKEVYASLHNVLAIIACGLSFSFAFYATFYGSMFSFGLGDLLPPIFSQKINNAVNFAISCFPAVAISGATATALMIVVLNAIFPQLHFTIVKASLGSGALSAFLSIPLMMAISLHSTFWANLACLAFFAIWQSVMMTLLCLPLL